MSFRELSRLYWEEQLSQSQAAQKLGITRPKVNYLMKRHNIPRRNRSEAAKLSPHKTKFVKGQKPWNTGLTKTDPRVKAYSDKNKGRQFSEEHRKKLSQISRPDNIVRNEERAIMPKITEEHARQVFENFKRYRRSLREFCKSPQNTTGLKTAGSLRKLFQKFFSGEYEAFTDTKGSHTYKIGRNFEYRVRNIFKEKGYFVLRSPRSGGPTDLIAIKKGEVLCIQCKCVRSCFSLAEKEKLIALATSIGATPLLASREGNMVKIEVASNVAI